MAKAKAAAQKGAAPAQQKPRRPRKPRPPTGNPIGRPSLYSPGIAAEVLGRMTEGNSLRTICKADDMPAPSTIFLWLKAYPEFSEQYALACDQRADAIFEESLEIADDREGDVTLTEDGPVFNNARVQRDRLRVDTRRWFVGKLAPKKYGEKQAIDVSGSLVTPEAASARKKMVGVYVALLEARARGELPESLLAVLDGLDETPKPTPLLIEGKKTNGSGNGHG